MVTCLNTAALAGCEKEGGLTTYFMFTLMHSEGQFIHSDSLPASHPSVMILLPHPRGIWQGKTGVVIIKSLLMPLCKICYSITSTKLFSKNFQKKLQCIF